MTVITKTAIEIFNGCPVGTEFTSRDLADDLIVLCPENPKSFIRYFSSKFALGLRISGYVEKIGLDKSKGKRPAFIIKKIKNIPN